MLVIWYAYVLQIRINVRKFQAGKMIGYLSTRVHLKVNTQTAAFLVFLLIIFQRNAGQMTNL